MNNTLKLLIIEDSHGDIELILRKLESGGYRVEYEVVSTLPAFEEAVQHKEWDIIFYDHTVPDFKSTQALSTLRAKELDIPFIFFIDDMSEDTAIQAMQQGASDYVLKTNLKRLVPAVEREVRDARIRNEHRKIQKELLESKNLLDKTFESLKEAVFVINPENRTIITCNPAAERMFGYEKHELIGKNTEFLHTGRDEYNRFGEESLQALNASGVFHTEFRMRRRNGDLFPTENTVTEITDDKERRIGLVSVVRDITKRKETEEALQQSERRFRKIIEKAPDGFVLLSKGWKFTYASPSALKTFGYSLEEYEHLNPNDLTHPEDLPAVLAELDKLINDPSKTPILQYRFKRKDGTLRWIESTFSNLLAEPGIEAILINFRDITDRKELETRLQLHAHLLDEIGEAVMATDLDGKIIYWNKAAEKLYGWAAEEVIGKDVLDVTPSQMSKAQAAEIMEALRKGESWSGEFIVQRKDGSTFSALVTDSPFFDSNGKLAGSIGISTDITERKRFENAIKESEEKYRTLIEISADAIFINQNNKIVYLNHSAVKLFGAEKPEQIIGKSPFEVFHPDYHEIIKNRINEMLERGKLVPMLEEKIIQLNGTVVDVEVTASPFIFKGEHAIQVVLRDVTNRKEREKQIRFQASLLDQVNNGVLALDNDGKIIYWNKYAEKLHGWKKEEVIGKYPAEFLLTEESLVQLDHFTREFELGKQWSGELMLLRKDGSKFPAYATYSLLYDTERKIIGTVAVSVDITEQKKAEELVMQSKEQLLLQSTALESAANAIAITDIDGIIKWANPAFCKLTGYSEEEIIGSKPNLLKSGKMSDEYFADLWNTVLSGNVWRGELINKRKDGTLYDEEMTITPVKNLKGEITHFVTVKEDVTREKELQRQIFQAQKLESIGTLASGIAHDFNNILGIILGYCTLLERSRKDEERFKKNIETISRAVKRGANLVQQILAFARKSDMSFEILNINTVVRELSQMLRETFPKSVSIDLKLDENIPALVMDQTQINQALLNLCVNARDAILEKEKPYGTITIRTSYIAGQKLQKKFPDAVPDKYVVISVSDTGTGIEESVRDRLYDPFYTTKAPDKGTGLGLSLVYGVVKTYNGFVDLESEVGKGTTFTLYLPIYQEIEEKESDEQPEEKISTKGIETLLVVEDEEMLRNMLEELLGKQGYKVILASDGEEGVEKYKQFKDEIALVISDLGLPRMSGIDLFNTLLNIDQDVKTILASGFIDAGVSSELYKKGIREIIRKPYDSAELLQKVRTTLDG